MYQTSKEILQLLGKKILEYYLSVTKKDQDIYLFIDDFLFESLIEDSNLSREEVIRSLNEIQCRTTNAYIALSIVSFHVKILYDLNDVSEDSYYSQLQISYDSLKDLDHAQILSRFFYGCNFTPALGDADGEIIWDLTKDLFKKNNRTLKVCDFHYYKGRFVDLPNSQKIIKGSIRRILLDYIKDFNRLGLQPNQGGVSFDYIKRNITLNYFPSDPIKIDILYRLIFNFYNIWNGETKEDYINHREYSGSRKIKEDEIENDEAVIVYTPGSNEFEFYLNKQKIDNECIPNKYISKLKRDNCIFVRNGKDSSYWILYDNDKFSLKTIEEILVVYKRQNILTSSLPNILINDNVTDYFSTKIFDDYQIYIFKYPIAEQENKMFFNIYLNSDKKNKLFELASGIKVKPYRNVWYRFALPVIIVFDIQQKEIYIDGEKYELEYEEESHKEIKYLQITSEMLKMIDRHKVRLKDSSEFTFYVEAFPVIPDINFTNSGWIINREKAAYEISSDTFVIDGFNINEKNCYKKHEPRRDFLSVLDRSKNYNIINHRIENWRKYGKE